MKISTATSVFVNYLLEDAIEQGIKLGIEGIDLWCGRPHLFRRDYREDILLNLKERIMETGMEVVSVMPAFYRYPFSLCSPIEEVRTDSIEYMKDCIDNAVLMGAQHVLVIPTNSVVTQSKDEADRLFIRSLEEVCFYAQGRSMKLALEVLRPGISSYMNHTDQALKIIRGLQTDVLGLVLDTGLLNLSGEDFESAVGNSWEYLTQIHINDNNAIEQQNLIPGDGNIDFKGELVTLKKLGYRGFLTLELGAQYSVDAFEHCSRAVLRVREYIKAAQEIEQAN